jgi:hypothetical protein
MTNPTYKITKFSLKQWLTIGIKTSCKRKRQLYLLSKLHDNNNLKQYYEKYSEMLVKVIKKAKNLTTIIKLQTTKTLLKLLGILLERSWAKTAQKIKL